MGKKKDAARTKGDSLERVMEDTRKSRTDYWGCDGRCSLCTACEGVRPTIVYKSCAMCSEAQALDLLRRTAMLLAGGGAAGVTDARDAAVGEAVAELRKLAKMVARGYAVYCPCGTDGCDGRPADDAPGERPTGRHMTTRRFKAMMRDIASRIGEVADELEAAHGR